MLTVLPLIDMLTPRIHIYARVIKDIMAAIVLLSACGAVIVAILVFLPYLINIQLF